MVIVGFLKSCTANATLNENSSCQQFQQADTTTQDRVLQDMIAAHHSHESVTVTRFSVTLYCNVHDDNSLIDGIYNSSNVDQKQLQNILTPTVTQVFSSVGQTIDVAGWRLTLKSVKIDDKYVKRG